MVFYDIVLFCIRTSVQHLLRANYWKKKFVLQYLCTVKYRKPPDIMRNNQKTIGRRIKDHGLTNTTIALIRQTIPRVSLSINTVIPPYGPKNQKSTRAAVLGISRPRPRPLSEVFMKVEGRFFPLIQFKKLNRI